MTVMLLALLIGDPALNASGASDYRLSEGREAQAFAGTQGEGADHRRWTPGIDSWTRKGSDCPAFFQRDMGGFGIFRFGPRCSEEELPYTRAHPAHH